MTVTSAVKHWNGATGSRSGSRDNELSEYTAVFKVTTDDALDQPNVILAYFKNTASLPYLGDQYAYGNDFNANSLCKRIRPVRERGSAHHWQVTVDYEPPGGGEQEKPSKVEDGKTTKDPRQWADEINISHTTVRVPVWKAIHRGGIEYLEDGEEMPPSNSALDVFDPPLEKQIHIRVVRITRYQLQYDGVTAGNWLGWVNNDAKVIDKIVPYYHDIWQPHCSYFAEFGGSSEFINGASVWKNTAEFHVHPFTWWEDVIDRGLYVKLEAGDNDGRGGTISNSDFVDGRPKNRRIVDHEGRPMTEPQLLNGRGKLLEPAFPASDPVWIRYQIYGEKSFAALEI